MASDRESRSYLQQAYTSKLFTTIDLLLAKTINEDKALTKIKRYLENEAEVNAINYNDRKRNTALHIMVQHGYQKIVTFLLDNIWDVKTDIINADGQTVLNLADQSRSESIKSLLENYVNKSRSTLKFTYSSNDPSYVLKALRNRQNILKVEIDSSDVEPHFLSDKQFFEAIESCGNLIFVDITTCHCNAQYEPTIKSQLSTIVRPLIFQFGPVENKNACFRDSETDEIAVIALKNAEVNFNGEIFHKTLSSVKGFGLKLFINALQLKLIGKFNGLHHSLSNVKFVDLEKGSFIDHVIKRVDLLTLKFLCLHIKPEDLLIHFTAKYENVDKLSAIVTAGMLQSNGPESQLQYFKNMALKAAVVSESFEIAKFLVEKGAETSQNIINIAYATKRFDIVLLLLKADSIYPQEFDIEHIQDTVNETFKELKHFVDTREELHTFIEKDDLPQVKKLMQSMDISKTYLNTVNYSAVHTALKFNRLQIYVWLKSQMGAELRDENEIADISLDVLLNAKTLLAQLSFVPIEDAHILYLVSISKSFHEPKDNFKQTIEKYYKDLDSRRPQVSHILKVVQCGKHLDIIYDMDSDSIKNSALAHSSVKGECDYIAGRIYIGGKREEKELLGTIAHELTHQAMQILFENDTKPYKQDPNQRNKFNEILEIVKKGRFTADEIINKVFTTYNEKSWHSELIVTVNHMIGKYGQREGTRLLTKQVPQLLEYYDKEIVPCCEDLIEGSHQLGLRNSIKLLNDYSGVIANLQDKQIALNKPIVKSYEMGAINCIVTDFVLLSSIRILNSLKDESGTFLFFNYGRYLIRRNDVHKVFNYDVCKTLILVCESKPDSTEFANSVKMLLDVLEQKNSKRVIFIMKDDMNLESIFKVPPEVPISSDDLSVETMQMLLERTVSLQDVKLQLKNLIDKDTFHLIDPHTLTKLINREEIEIGSQVVTDLKYDEVQEYYIERKFDRYIKIRSDIKKDASNFHIIYKSGEIYDDQVQKDRDIVLIYDSEEDFRELCTKHSDRDIHWLKLVEETEVLRWQKSHGNLSRLWKYSYVDEWAMTECDGDSVIEDNIALVVAEAGMGKSTVLSHVALKTKMNRKQEVWVARVNLADYSTELNRLKQAQVQLNEIEAIKFLYMAMGFQLFKTKRNETLLEREMREKLVQEVISSVVVEEHNISINKSFTGIATAFEIQLFNQLYNQRKIDLLFDGFDEINPEYRVQGIQLLNVLRGSKIRKLWVSTRPHDVHELEVTLGTFSYRLKPFCLTDQQLFLKQFWATKLKPYTIANDTRSMVFIEELLNSFSKSIRDDKRTESVIDIETEFLSVPLHIQMIAEIYQNKFQEFYDTNSEKHQENMFSDEHNLVSLFKTFFKIKFFKILYGDKSPTMNADVPKMRFLLENEYKDVEHDHAILAIYTLYSAEDWETLFTSEEKNRVSYLIKTIEQSRERTGLIDRIAIGKPMFVHQTFAEYFAALWFERKWREPLVSAFLCEHIFQEGQEVIRNFFDLMLANNGQSQVHMAVINRNISTTKDLLQNKCQDIEAVDNGGRTALHVASAYGYEDFVQVLLEHGALVTCADDIFNWKPVRYADRNRHWSSAELLLQSGADGEDMSRTIEYINVQIASEMKTALHVVSEKGYMKLVELLTSKGANIRVQANSNLTPLHSAVIGGHLEIVKFLIAHGVDPNVKYFFGRTPLHVAARRGHLDMVKYLLENNAELDNKNEYNQTPLMFAAQLGHLEVVKYLVEKNADLKIEDILHRTHMYYAAQGDHLKVVQYLFEKDASVVNIKTTNGRSPLHIAAEKGNLRIVEYLLKKQVDINLKTYFNYTTLHYAADGGRLEMVKFLVKNGADLNITNDSNDSPLYLAAEKGKLEIVKFLLENGADLNIENKSGRTPLFIAAERGHLEIVKCLIKNVAEINLELKKCLVEKVARNGHLGVLMFMMDNNVNFCINIQYNILHLAADCGHLRIVQYLVENDANVNIINEHGKTPLHFAAKSHSLELIKCLVEKGANINSKDKYGTTPLSIAISVGQLEIVKYFVGREADLNMRSECGYIPIQFASVLGRLEIVKYLSKLQTNLSADIKQTLLRLSAGHGKLEVLRFLKENVVHLSTSTPGSKTALHFAAEKGQLDIVRYLVAQQVELNVKTKVNETPLYLAAVNDHLEIVKCLLDNDADININSKYGQTLLHTFARKCNLDMIQYCVDKGAMVICFDDDGWTPLHFAILYGALDIVKYFANEKDADVNRNAIQYGCLNFKFNDWWNFAYYAIPKKDPTVPISSRNGVTSMHIAALSDNVNILKFLVKEKRVDINKCDLYGWTPLEVAKRFNKQKSVEFFRDCHVDCLENLLTDDRVYHTETKKILLLPPPK